MESGALKHDPKSASALSPGEESRDPKAAGNPAVTPDPDKSAIEGHQDAPKPTGEDGSQEDDADRRRYERTTVLWNARLLYKDDAVDCMVINISAEGAMIQCFERLVVGTNVILKNDRLDTLAAKVVWENDRDQYGLQFLDDRDEIAQRLGYILP